VNVKDNNLDTSKRCRGPDLLEFGFDTIRLTDVRIGYAELICNDFILLNN
jgi:hypothetical protein